MPRGTYTESHVDHGLGSNPGSVRDSRYTEAGGDGQRNRMTGKTTGPRALGLGLLGCDI